VTDFEAITGRNRIANAYFGFKGAVEALSAQNPDFLSCRYFSRKKT
jgi:hypothetical protein